MSRQETEETPAAPYAEVHVPRGSRPPSLMQALGAHSVTAAGVWGAASPASAGK